MGKVIALIESGVYNTKNLHEIVRVWLDYVSRVDAKTGYSGFSYSYEYQNCKVSVVKNDEE